jgi:hypothetical protein
MIEPGSLLKIKPGVDWCNAHVIDSNDNIVAELHFTASDVAVFISSRSSRFENIERYRCLVGSTMALFHPMYLVEVNDE